MKNTFGDRVLNSKLHNRIAYAEVTHEGKGVFEYSDPKAREEITTLVNELVKTIQSL
jgi:cellulose biosynthesis protein BcsQ